MYERAGILTVPIKSVFILNKTLLYYGRTVCLRLMTNTGNLRAQKYYLQQLQRRVEKNFASGSQKQMVVA